MRTALVVLLAILACSVAPVRAEDAPKNWDFNGVTKAVANLEMRARVSGYVTRIAFKEGDAVKRGDLLIEIDPRPYQLALDAALGRMKEADARFVKAKLSAENAQRLYDKKVVNEIDLQMSIATKVEAEAALLTAKAEVQRAELDLSWTKVTAPFDGRTSKLHVTEGSLVVADQTPLMNLVSTGMLRVSFTVPETVYLRLRKEAQADPSKFSVAVGFSSEEGFPHETKLDFIEPTVDAKSGTVRFQASLADPEKMLLPGMSARVRLKTLEK